MQGSSSSSCVNPSLAVAVAPPARRIVVAHRLPLRASPDPDSPFGFAFSLDPDALSLQLSRGLPAPVTYIGTLPASAESKVVPSDELDGYLLERFSCLPVHLDDDRHAEFYDGFCKRYLWPLLHYVLPFTPTDAVERLRFDAASYRAFVTANRQFADRVVQVVSPDAGDLVIVHDYHLWALPTFLRRKCPRAGVGFFLHSPFPSAEILHSVPVRDELLGGLLNADLVGFHTLDYARQFVSCCSRLLGISSSTSLRGHTGIDYHGRTVLVRIFSVGVDMAQLRAALASPEAAAKAREIAEAYRGRVIMVGVDDVDLFKGVSLKLLALERMLEAHRDMVRQVVLVQINNPARSRGRDADAVRVETRRIEQRINKRFGPAEGSDSDLIVVTIDSPVPMWEKVAYYAAADCCVVSAVRDGLNRIPYFYTVCREEAPGGARRSGAVVLSEFAGCSAALGGAIRVNPWDPEALADAMRAAVTMGAEEKRARHRANYSYLSAHDAAAWARSFDEALRLACRDLPAMRFVGLGLGMTYRAVAVRGPSSQQMLTAERVRPAYRGAARRLILLGCDGAMAPELVDEGESAPRDGALRLLDELCDDPRNVVFLVSGRRKDQLAAWFASCEKLGICAEHGYFTR
ncbi:probable alpha,alpha-trehalose-phosphate synthase [UDP-forming] 11 [Panicum virgatum]|nr:probable alpha,alpha-trehalose-phosphate synthase [UDP-forming] 11 [Panicum virgatum]